MAKKTKITELTFDDKNFNRGTAYGKTLMEKSLSKFGAGRSVLIDKNNRIIAGNKTAETFGEIGLENVQIVETDGTTLIAVKRTDIDLDTPQGRELALADNQTAKVNIDFDFDMLKSELTEDKIESWGITIDDEIDNMEDGDDIEIPKSLQVIPKKEYIIVYADEDSEEWQELQQIFKCGLVRQGGCKIGSSSDKVGRGIERVFDLKTFKERVLNEFSNSNTK